MLDINKVTVYLPEVKEFLYISEGSGDNLDSFDLDQGYIDYVYYETYIYTDRALEEQDGGMYLLRESFDSKYDDIDTLIKDILDFHYENKDLKYIKIETPDYEKEIKEIDKE